jgi:hypothetical protein
MRKVLLLVLILILGSFAPAANAAAAQVNYEAALFGPAFPSADPCVVYDVRVDALRFIPPSDSPLVTGSVGVQNICTGEWLSLISTDVVAIDESAFTVSPDLEGADLNATVLGFDSVDQTESPLTFNLHWSSQGNFSDGTAAVTGTITRGSLIIVFDNSITWNRWGSESFPWAGLWFCAFHGGCIGQA